MGDLFFTMFIVMVISWIALVTVITIKSVRATKQQLNQIMKKSVVFIHKVEPLSIPESGFEFDAEIASSRMQAITAGLHQM